MNELEMIKNEGDALMQKPDIDNLPKKKEVLQRKVRNVIVKFPEKQRVFGGVNIKNLPDFEKIFKFPSIVFPDIQKIIGKVSVTNFPAIQKITGTVKAEVQFPETQEVKVKNFPKTKDIVFPDSTKIELTKQQKELFNEILYLLKFPLSDGAMVDAVKANPSRYLNVRMTNGKQFVEMAHSINANNGQLVQLLKEINNKTTASGGSTDTTPTTYGSGQATVTTAGTQVQLASNGCKSVTVKAKTTNTGNIFVGDLSVDSSTGFILSAGESLSLDISNTDKLWIDSSIDAQGISFAFVN